MAKFVSFNLNTEWECLSDIMPVYKNVAAAHHCFSVSFQENLCIEENKNLVSADEPSSWTQLYWFLFDVLLLKGCCCLVMQQKQGFLGIFSVPEPWP